jgi:SAM-dependent methyltransferase
MTEHRAETPPSSWISRFAHLVPQGCAVLDLACGTGRHVRYFTDHGHPVTAVDRNAKTLAALGNIPGIETLVADLEDGGRWPLERRSFGAVIITNYLHRPLLGHIIDSVEPGGVLLYETFARGNEAFGKPSNPDFLLAPGELLEAVRGKLRVVAYEDGVTAAPRAAAVQRLAAVWRDPSDTASPLSGSAPLQDE